VLAWWEWVLLGAAWLAAGLCLLWGFRLGRRSVVLDPRSLEDSVFTHGLLYGEEYTPLTATSLDFLAALPRFELDQPLALDQPARHVVQLAVPMRPAGVLLFTKALGADGLVALAPVVRSGDTLPAGSEFELEVDPRPVYVR
jgi:hypothetical protein